MRKACSLFGDRKPNVTQPLSPRSSQYRNHCQNLQRNLPLAPDPPLIQGQLFLSEKGKIVNMVCVIRADLCCPRVEEPWTYKQHMWRISPAARSADFGANETFFPLKLEH